MRLTTFSDYALRVLLYAAAMDGRLITIEETARLYGISRTHLMKVVNLLTQAGILKGVRGRSGGVTLARPAAEIGLGDVLRATEQDFHLVECFSSGATCRITACCRLPGPLNDALQAFISTLDRYTLADALLTPEAFAEDAPRSADLTGPPDPSGERNAHV